MGLAGFGMESLADDAAVADNDTADHGVRAGVSGRLARQLHAPPHVVAVHVARLRLAPHTADEATAPPDREAGAARRGRRGGGGGARSEVGARDERGGHVRRAEETPPIQRAVCVIESEVVTVRPHLTSDPGEALDRPERFGWSLRVTHATPPHAAAPSRETAGAGAAGEAPPSIHRRVAFDLLFLINVGPCEKGQVQLHLLVSEAQ